VKHLICYSGGHSSALVAIEVARKFGAENLILLNHDINSSVEHADIKRFKKEVAAYLGVGITFANHPDFAEKDQFDIAIDNDGFKFGLNIICTSRLKTEPFAKYLKANFPTGDGLIIYYGFDARERERVQRRSQILGTQGYKTDFPLFSWKDRTIFSTKEIGIEPPLTYSTWKHANCVGCLKGGKQHWYSVYCFYPEIWAKAKKAENEIGHSILKETFLEDLEPQFEKMKLCGVAPTEKIPPGEFWAEVRRKTGNQMSLDFDEKPCECVI